MTYESYLKTVYIKLTNRCNLTCDHCYNSVCKDQGQMSEKTITKIVDYIYDLTEQGYMVEVALHGGEPMLFRDMELLWDLVLTLEEMGVYVTMTTNLVYRVNNEHIALFAHFKQMDGTCLVLTSWDYKIRFKKKEQLLQWERSVKKILSHEIRVQPIVSLTKLLLEEKTPEEIFEYMYNLGVPNMNFERLTCNGRAKDNNDVLMPTNKQVDEWLAHAYKVYRENENWKKMEIPIFESLEWAVAEGKFIGCRERKCTQNVRTFNPDGSCATCPNIPLDILGNINSQVAKKQLYDIEGGIESNKKYIQLREQEELRKDECYLCDLFSVCNGDCFQLGWDDTGCPGLKETFKEVARHASEFTE